MFAEGPRRPDPARLRTAAARADRRLVRAVAPAAFAAVAALAALPLGAAQTAPADASPPPAVSVMVVGRGGLILAGPRSVRAGAVTLGVGRRRCAVAARTPLAALAALHRAGGPGYALRDYGSCGRAPVDSGQLFVRAVAGERNSGQDGWEYKVNDRSGVTGAADTTGPQGDGRLLRPGSRVLWFWCVQGPAGCQRTLSVSVRPAPGARALELTVTAADDEGRSAPVEGAVVTLAGASAASDAAGHASLPPPSSPGSWSVSAAKPGFVPSFPAPVAVG